MARPRKPTAVLEARGAFKKDPQRKRTDPEVREPIGNPPDDFTDTERDAWLGIVRRAPLGVLTGADWQAVVLASKLWAEFMTDYSKFSVQKISRLHTLLGSFGMTPSDRARLNIAKPKDENPFDTLGK